MTNKDKHFDHILIIGYGDIGMRVATSWPEPALPTYALKRSVDLQTSQLANNITLLHADLDQPASLENLPLNNALIFYFAPPPTTGITDSRMQNFLASIEPDALPSRLVYISTSGVYGDQKGQLVSESTPANPQVDRARRRYDAETQLRQWSDLTHVPVIILRVGGIYGPGRLPLKRIKDHIPLVYEELAPQTNRIHADDLAQVCIAAALIGQPDQVYNVSDGTNSNMTEYFNTIADYFNLPRPPLVDWEEAEQTISKGMLSYLRESRRLDNSRMLNELKVQLKYKNLKAGLESCK